MVSFHSHLAGTLTVPVASHTATCSLRREPAFDPIALMGLVFKILLGLSIQSMASEPETLLQPWFQAQSNLQSWTADVTQIRSFKTLTQPLTNQGRIWFSAPNRFRWELGQPAQTIAVRQPDQMLVIYPKLRRVERYQWQENGNHPWRDALALLEAGFPRNQADWERRFQLLHHQRNSDRNILVFQPAAAGARRMIPQIKVEFSREHFDLLAMDLQFADGSTLRNEFHNSRRNVPLEETLFSPSLDPQFKILDPLAPPNRKPETKANTQ